MSFKESLVFTTGILITGVIGMGAICMRNEIFGIAMLILGYILCLAVSAQQSL